MGSIWSMDELLEEHDQNFIFYGNFIYFTITEKNRKFI